VTGLSQPDRIRVGVDVAEEGELAALVWKPAVRCRVFSDREITRCLGFGDGSIGAFTRCFAAKEAVLKAAGIDGATLKEIEIIHDAAGALYVSWSRLESNGLRVSVSVSSAAMCAVAVAIVY
jgi:phosphopantetheine--protein transferase-like protein